MASSNDKRRERRVIYRISDSRRHLVGPSRLGSLATLYHPHLPVRPPDSQPVLSHLPELPSQNPTDEVVPTEHDLPECAGFVAAGSWGTAPGLEATTTENHHIHEENHPILNAIIEDGLSHTPGRQDTSGFASSFSANPSVLDLIPELQRSQSYYYTNVDSSSTSWTGASSVVSTGWMGSFDLGLPSSVTTTQAWPGHLKSVLFDVLKPSSDGSFPTVLQPRFKKSPGTSAALFVPNVMASIWRQYSGENQPCPLVSDTAKHSIVSQNNRDYTAPVSGSRIGESALNKRKNAKTASLSASVKRRSAYGTTDAGENTQQNHDMAGGRLARWQTLLKYVLTGLKNLKQPAAVELQDMSSLPPSDSISYPTENNTAREPDEEFSLFGEVTFFHYNSDGKEYSCTSVPIVPADSAANQGGGETRDAEESLTRYTCSENTVIVDGSDSDAELEEERERVIESVLIQELEHDKCACRKLSSHSDLDGPSVAEVESSSFIAETLTSEYSDEKIPNGNVNGNCPERDTDSVHVTVLKRRTSSIKKIPKIIRDKLTFHHHHRPRQKIAGSSSLDNSADKTCLDDKKNQTMKSRRRKRKVYPQPVEKVITDEPFEWPENYVHVNVPPRWIPPKSDAETKKYVGVASAYVPTVYVKLYIQVPPATHLCGLKTHMLICIFRSFFTTTEGLYINWVVSLQSHVYNLLYMDVARVRFRRKSNGKPCRACLLLSQDATVLVRHKQCSLLTTITDILQIAPEELLVMEKGQRNRGLDRI